MSQRYLLCVQHPGLNDVLCQFEACFRYALQFGRTLLMDTRPSGLMGEFGDYFDVIDSSVEVVSSSNDWDYDALNQLSCRPTILEGRLDDYDVFWTGVYPPYVEKHSGIVINFDMDADHPEDILVHQQPGGGKLSWDGLRRLRLTPRMAGLIRDSLARCGSDYVGVHVRNTDYQTDYETYLHGLIDEVRGKRVLVCSDDGRVIQRARELFSDSEVFSASGNSRMDGKPLHRSYSHDTEAGRKQAAIMSFIDLFALAFADKLYCAKITGKTHNSGFALLATGLQQNEALKAQLLNME